MNKFEIPLTVGYIIFTLYAMYPLSQPPPLNKFHSSLLSIECGASIALIGLILTPATSSLRLFAQRSLIEKIYLCMMLLGGIVIIGSTWYALK